MFSNRLNRNSRKRPGTKHKSLRIENLERRDLLAADLPLGTTSLKFDGVDDIVSIPSSPSLQINQSLTLEFWAKRTRLDGLDVVLEKGGDWTRGQTNYGVGLHAATNHNMFYFTFANGWQGVDGVRDLEWHGQSASST